VSWPNRFLAGAAALAGLGAISVAALAIGVVEAGGSAQLAGANVLSAGPATIIESAQRA
jgi:hypothetical protein